jgi:hypothetical protein
VLSYTTLLATGSNTILVIAFLTVGDWAVDLQFRERCIVTELDFISESVWIYLTGGLAIHEVIWDFDMKNTAYSWELSSL